MNTIKRMGIFTGAWLLLVTSSFAFNVMPQAGIPGQWQLLASIPVGRMPSHDILVLGGFHTDFQSIRFSVANSTVHMDGIIITFSDGSTANIEFRADLHPGTQSSAFDLPGGRRDIHSIEFWHQSIGQFHGPAVVSVFGLK